MPSKKRSQVGVILAAHGIRGQVKIRSFTDTPKAIFKLPITDETGSRSFALTPFGGRDDQLLAAIEGISDRNEAERLKGTVLYAETALLPKRKKNQFLHSELVGLTAKLKSGETYGKVLSTHNFGAGDIIEVELPGKKTEMLPFNSNYIGKIDMDSRTIIIHPPEYLEAKAK